MRKEEGLLVEKVERIVPTEVRFIYAPATSRLLFARNLTHIQLALRGCNGSQYAVTAQAVSGFTFHGIFLPRMNAYSVWQMDIARNVEGDPPEPDQRGLLGLLRAIYRHVPWACTLRLTYDEQLTQVQQNGCTRLFYEHEESTVQETVGLLEILCSAPLR